MCSLLLLACAVFGMNRRSFMQSILAAAGVALWVCTSAGVLMPVRKFRATMLPPSFVSPSWAWVPGLGEFRSVDDAFKAVMEHPDWSQFEQSSSPLFEPPTIWVMPYSVAFTKTIHTLVTSSEG